MPTKLLNKVQLQLSVNKMKLKKLTKLILFAFLTFTTVNAQEDDPILPYKVAPQNLLKFNRFLINPTFSTVQEDKSYINLLHRNQSVQFEDNDQTYFLSYSGRMGDRSGLGLSLYTQKVGPVSNIGVLANYAYGVKLSDKSNFTFGANLAYYSSGLNRNNVDVVDVNDFRLNGTEDSNVLSFQPGINLSYGNFDVGAFAENLIDYNLKTSESLTEFKDKTYSAHLQYTHQFKKTAGIMESARLMPLARVKMIGEDDVELGGSLLLDLPKIGWLQGGYDTFYGASAGVGFNINKRLSLGYTFEKGLNNDFDNLGITHEISFAYSFTPNLTEDRVMLEEDYEEEIAENAKVNAEDLATNDELEALKKKLAENDEVLAELMFKQDSLEANRQLDLERRFNLVMKMVRSETNGERPDVEKRAKDLFYTGRDKPAVAQNTTTTNQPIVRENNNSYTKNSSIASVTPVTTNTNKIVEKTPQPIATRDNTQQRDYASVTPKQEPIKSRKFKNLEGVQDGYYVIANVYKGGQYLDKFISKLEDKGINADYIDNQNNGLKYVYLKRYETWDQAAEAYKSNLNGNYNGKLWIMNVDNRYSNEAYASNVNKLKEKSSKYNSNNLQSNVIVKDNIAATEPTPKTYVIDGANSGYYIIANVFANPNNANRFVKLLNSYGLNASYFINPENKYRYVYLKRHESWNNALISYYSKLNDAYDDKMWIMRVNREEEMV